MGLPITSRYRGLPVVNAPATGGTTQPTVAIRRHVPPADTVDYQHLVTGLETVEYLAWRYYGNSEAWWRIADANPVRFPLDLRTGDTLAVPANPDAALVRRDRVF